MCVYACVKNRQLPRAAIRCVIHLKDIRIETALLTVFRTIVEGFQKEKETFLSILTHDHN